MYVAASGGKEILSWEHVQVASIRGISPYRPGKFRFG